MIVEYKSRANNLLEEQCWQEPPTRSWATCWQGTLGCNRPQSDRAARLRIARESCWCCSFWRGIGACCGWWVSFWLKDKQVVPFPFLSVSHKNAPPPPPAFRLLPLAGIDHPSSSYSTKKYIINKHIYTHNIYLTSWFAEEPYKESECKDYKMDDIMNKHIPLLHVM